MMTGHTSTLRAGATVESPPIPSLRSLHQIAGRPAPNVSAMRDFLCAETIIPYGEGGLCRLQSRAGILLTDASFNPMWFNDEALRILSYPDKFVEIRRRREFLTRQIRFNLMTPQRPRELPFVSEFLSGNRRYVCRTLSLDSHSRGRSQPRLALLLERDPFGAIALAKASQRFQLTQREEEVLGCLLQGLSNKEIADRMNVSCNTIKTFLHLMMVKIGVASRTAIVGRITATRPL